MLVGTSAPKISPQNKVESLRERERENVESLPLNNIISPVFDAFKYTKSSD